MGGVSLYDKQPYGSPSTWRRDLFNHQVSRSLKPKVRFTSRPQKSHFEEAYTSIYIYIYIYIYICMYVYPYDIDIDIDIEIEIPSRSTWSAWKKCRSTWSAKLLLVKEPALFWDTLGSTKKKRTPISCRHREFRSEPKELWGGSHGHWNGGFTHWKCWICPVRHVNV